MGSISKSLDDWELYTYKENGTLFTVAQLKGQPQKQNLQEDGPYESFNRKGRFLIPTNFYRDVTLVPAISSKMFERQRKEILFRPGDICVTTFPRSGTTWTEQLVLLLLTKGNPEPLNTKNKNAYHLSQPERIGKVFIDLLYHETPTKNINEPWGFTCGQDLTITAGDLDAIKFRRVLKTHHLAHMMIGMGEAAEALEKREIPPFIVPNVKFLWVIRDPKDVVLSMMRINSMNFEDHKFPLAAFVKAFLAGKTNRGCWAQHTREWYECYKKHPKNVLPLIYEDGKKDPEGTARHVAEFLDINLTPDELQKCLEFSSFDKMKEMSKGAETQHMSRGQVGGWRERFTPDMLEAFNKMCSDPSLGKYGSRYVHSINELR